MNAPNPLGGRAAWFILAAVGILLVMFIVHLGVTNWMGELDANNTNDANDSSELQAEPLLDLTDCTHVYLDVGSNVGVQVGN